MLDGAPFPTNASIRDFAKGRDGYVANSEEQALLLLMDMAELRNLKRHTVFLSLKRELVLVKILTPTPINFFFFLTIFFSSQ